MSNLFIVSFGETSVSCVDAQEVSALIGSADASAHFSVTHMGYEEFFFGAEKPSEEDIVGAFEDAPRWAGVAAKKEARDKERV